MAKVLNMSACIYIQTRSPGTSLGNYEIFHALPLLPVHEYHNPKVALNCLHAVIWVRSLMSNFVA